MSMTAEEKSRKILGDNIYYVCRRKSITLRRLAADMGYPYNSLLNWTRGRVRISAAEVARIADYLGVRTDALLNGVADCFK